MPPAPSLALTEAARQAWQACSHPPPLVEQNVPAFTPHQFDKMLASPFGSAATTTCVRSFVMSTPPIRIHTNGRKPHPSIARTAAATALTLQTMYGKGVALPSDVFMCESDHQKYIPTAGRGPLTVNHINSGFSAGRRIALLRCEESQRTLVHEMLHVARVHRGPQPAASARRAHQRLGAPANVLLLEAFVEACTWLIMSGFCPRACRARKAILAARALVGAGPDDGATNAWAYLTGKALLVCMDGGAAFHNSFFPQQRSGVRGLALQGKVMYDKLLSIMEAMAPRLAKAPAPPTAGRHAVRMCDCHLGPAFA